MGQYLTFQCDSCLRTCSDIDDRDSEDVDLCHACADDLRDEDTLDKSNRDAWQG